jgi:hypothetical protein
MKLDIDYNSITAFRGFKDFSLWAIHGLFQLRGMTLNYFMFRHRVLLRI